MYFVGRVLVIEKVNELLFGFFVMIVMVVVVLMVILILFGLIRIFGGKFFES